MTDIDRKDLIAKISHDLSGKLTWKIYLSVFISCIVTTASVVWTISSVYYGFQGKINDNVKDITEIQKMNSTQDAVINKNSDRLYRVEAVVFPYKITAK